MIRKLLVAFDGSQEANAAFNFALDLAKTYQAEIHVISVVRLPEPPVEVETQAFLENGTSHYKHLFNELRRKAKEATVNVKMSVVTGHPAEQILHRVEVEHADVLVMGHQTRSKLGKWLTGSVTDKVVDHAPCTVIVVKREHTPKQ